MYLPTIAVVVFNAAVCRGLSSNNNSSIIAADTIFGFNGTVTLRGNSNASNTWTLDYGANVEGLPTFEILSASGDTSDLVITYSESLSVLNSSPRSDGPVGLAAAMDSYRMNYYNITEPGPHTNRLIQGGFRYQRLTLMSVGELVLVNVGVKPTTSTTSITSLPGSFDCSDQRLTQIWRVGARTIQLNEIPALSIPEFWQVTSEGSLVDSQAPQTLSGAGAASLLEYSVEFRVQPKVGGFSFSVLSSTLNDGVYIWCNIVNGSISANDGTTESTKDFLASANLPANMTIGQWYNVKATVGPDLISVYIDGSMVIEFSQTYSFFGSFGLGAASGQSALFRDLKAITTSGDVIYESALTDSSFLDDFLMGTNPLNTTVDGSKRDRIAYTGDLDVAVGSTMTSTNGAEYIRGTLDLVGSFQLTPGFFVPTAKIQQAPQTKPIDANITGLIGYSFNLVTAVSNFYQQTGDVAIAQEWGRRIVRMLDWADSQVLSTNGLFNLSEASFGGDWNYYDPVQSGIVAKFNMVYAYALSTSLTLLEDAGIDPEPYSRRLAALRAAINSHLWSDQLQAYYLSDALLDGFGQDSNAMAILVGVTNSNHTAARVLKTLSELFTPSGPFAFSKGIVDAGFQKYISPYASAYHLRAAFMTGDEEVAKELLYNLWYPMADPAGANYTGCFWETLGANGEPGLGSITSLCHAWGAGPTGELSNYVLGVQAVKPGFREWKVAPVTLGLEWASGRIPVPGGRSITVSWKASNSVLTELEIESPDQTSGVVTLPNKSVWTLNGEEIDIADGTYRVAGGTKLSFVACACDQTT